MLVLLALLLIAVGVGGQGDCPDVAQFSPQEAYRIFHFRSYVRHDPQTLSYGVVIQTCTKATRVSIYHWDTDLMDPKWFSAPVLREFRSLLNNVPPERAEVEDSLKQIRSFVDEIVPESERPATGVVFVSPSLGYTNLIIGLSEIFDPNLEFSSVKAQTQHSLDKFFEGQRDLARVRGDEEAGRPVAYGAFEMGNVNARVSYELLRQSQLSHTFYKLSSYAAKKAQQTENGRFPSGEAWLKHSIEFAGFGLNSAHEAYRSLVLYKYKKSPSQLKKLARKAATCLRADCAQEPSGGDIRLIDDPCAPPGYLSELIMKPYGSNLAGTHRLIFDTVRLEGKSFLYKMRGTGSYDQCRELLVEVLQLAKTEGLYCKRTKNQQSCSVDLLGELFVPYDGLGLLSTGQAQSISRALLGSSQRYDHDAFVRRNREICETPETVSPPEGEPHLCFKAVWLETFLSEGLRMPADYKDLLVQVETSNLDPHRNTSLARELWIASSSTSE